MLKERLVVELFHRISLKNVSATMLLSSVSCIHRNLSHHLVTSSSTQSAHQAAEPDCSPRIHPIDRKRTPTSLLPREAMRRIVALAMIVVDRVLPIPISKAVESGRSIDIRNRQHIRQEIVFNRVRDLASRLAIYAHQVAGVVVDDEGGGRLGSGVGSCCVESWNFDVGCLHGEGPGAFALIETERGVRGWVVDDVDPVACLAHGSDRRSGAQNGDESGSAGDREARHGCESDGGCGLAV